MISSGSLTSVFDTPFHGGMGSRLRQALERLFQYHCTHSEESLSYIQHTGKVFEVGVTGHDLGPLVLGSSIDDGIGHGEAVS